MLWWYEPLNPKQLFFPALDAHSGRRHRRLRRHLGSWQPSGDFVLDLNSVRHGKYLPKRALPLGAQ